MDIFITIISWIVGLYAGFALMMAIVFSSAGAAQTNNSELKITSLISTLLLLYLIWIGISSVFFSDEKESSARTKVEKIQKQTLAQTTTVEKVTSPIKTNATNEANYNRNFILWTFYMIAFFVFFSWLFTPSKERGKGRDFIKQKFLASMRLKEDASGLKPWDANWQPIIEDEKD